MKERPILFSGQMVRAILDGRKTQTRRVFKGLIPPNCEGAHSCSVEGGFAKFMLNGKLAMHSGEWTKCPYGQPGDVLVVKEHAWMWCEKQPNGRTTKGRQKFRYVPLKSAMVFYCADNPSTPLLDVVSPNTGNQWFWRKKLGRFLPRWASRLTLEIVRVRVDLLQEISEEDAKAEGVEPVSVGFRDGRDGGRNSSRSHIEGFGEIWESINGAESWKQNPYVWVIEFKKL